MQHLARQGIPVPAPQADAAAADPAHAGRQAGRVVTRLPGSHQLAPDADHCAQVGAMLARLHLAVADFPLPAAQSARPGLVAADRAPPCCRT
jgi:homoserine kinase type II